VSFARRAFDGPPAVLVVGRGEPASAITDELEASLAECRVVAVGDRAAAVEEIDDRGIAVGCVVAPTALPERSGPELAAEIAEHPRSPPFVLVPETLDEEAALATTDGVTAIVPSGALDRLPAAVTDAVVDYYERLGDDLQLEAIETLFGEIEDVLQIKDAEGRYLRLHSNEEWPAEADALGQTDRVLHDDQFNLNERYFEEDQQVLSTGEPILGEVTGYGEGPLFWLETTKVPLRDDAGEVVGLVGQVRDVTDRMRHRAELEEKTRRLDRFAGYVSHDLRNPLSIAAGYLDLAREGDESALDDVEDAIERMQELVDDIELLARGDQRLLSAGSATDLATSRQRIATIAGNVWDVLATDAATLEIDLPAETVVYASEREFRSMLENLLKNAIDHAGEEVTVRIGATWDGFFLEDDGPGIPPADREQVFEQGYSTAKGGTGTGLSIVSEVAAGHDWELSVTESPDGGARFEVGNCLTVTASDRSPTLGESLELTDATDVGEPGEPGHSSFDPERETWTVSGAGEDIWGGENDFHFVHATLADDVRLEARVEWTNDVYEYSKAGVMLRQDLAEDSVHGFVGFTPDLVEVLWCRTVGERTTSQHLENADGGLEWVRIDRAGTTVTVSVSPDGEEWFPLDQRTLSMDDPIHAGLVVTSAVHREPAEATFDDVSLCRIDSE